MRLVPVLLLLGLSSAAAAQPATAPADEEPIVVRGITDGARVVEVDFDRVWKSCAECKRALKKLDRLAQPFRDERTTMRVMESGPAGCPSSSPSTLTTFQTSSADPITEYRPGARRDPSGELCAARNADSTRFTQEAVAQRFVVPEQRRMLGVMRAFLDQLAPHVARATEEERIANGASASITDRKRTRIGAKDVRRIDVTDAVIRRLDASRFTINLPDPPKPGPASGGYDAKLERIKD